MKINLDTKVVKRLHKFVEEWPRTFATHISELRENDADALADALKMLAPIASKSVYDKESMLEFALECCRHYCWPDVCQQLVMQYSVSPEEAEKICDKAKIKMFESSQHEKQEDSESDPESDPESDQDEKELIHKMCKVLLEAGSIDHVAETTLVTVFGINRDEGIRAWANFKREHAFLV